MTTPTVDSIIASFPNNKLNLSDEEPTYNVIKEAEKLIITKFTSIRSELWGGKHECLGLLLKAEKHKVITGSYFILHSNPGTFPTFPPLQTQPQIAQINATHKTQIRLWREQ